MPSTLVGALSGGVYLVSGNIYSGTQLPAGGVQLKLAAGAPGNVFVAVVPFNVPDVSIYSGSPNFLSGAVTANSGGALSSGGGLGDGMEMAPGDSYFVPKQLLASGRWADQIRVAVPAASSGGRVFWQPV